GVDETVIGLTVLAVGTSLPELATTVVAAGQKRTDVALGTIVGSNVFNILGILGVGALASSRPISVPGAFISLDFPVMLGSAILLTVFVCLRRPIGRMTGILFVLAYLAYIMMLVQRSRDIGI
ncbi:MAG: sodium:calcium antiporter, partial [Gemmatimonadota bacterium]